MSYLKVNGVTAFNKMLVELARLEPDSFAGCIGLHISRALALDNLKVDLYALDNLKVDLHALAIRWVKKKGELKLYEISGFRITKAWRYGNLRFLEVVTEGVKATFMQVWEEL